ncbi:ribosomal protein S25 [Acrasis kona]|uniref:40S ribosomal protein S25 n=1 Tax=Acrasis kona TaxID=1008807 RepID=A0AAW2YXZ1_9EUKA
MGKSKEIQAQKKSAKDANKDKSSGGSKQKKKKWSKGRIKEKLNNKVLFDKKTYANLTKDVPKMKLITLSRVSEQLGVTASVAKVGLRHLKEKGTIKPLVLHSKMLVYVVTAPEAEPAAAE